MLLPEQAGCLVYFYLYILLCDLLGFFLIPSLCQLIRKHVSRFHNFQQKLVSFMNILQHNYFLIFFKGRYKLNFLKGILSFEIPNVLHVSRNVLLRSSSDISDSFWAFVDPSVGSIENTSIALSLERHPSGFRTRRLQRKKYGTIIAGHDLHCQKFFLDLFTDPSLVFFYFLFLCPPQVVYVDITFILIRVPHFLNWTSLGCTDPWQRLLETVQNL